MEAKIINEYEPDLDALTIRMFDDGRFKVFVDGQVIFDKDRTGSFPDYETEIKPRLLAQL